MPMKEYMGFANAVLMASAPELLEENKKLRKEIKRLKKKILTHERWLKSLSSI